MNSNSTWHKRDIDIHTHRVTRVRARARAQPVGFVDEIAAGYYFELS